MHMHPSSLSQAFIYNPCGRREPQGGAGRAHYPPGDASPGGGGGPGPGQTLTSVDEKIRVCERPDRLGSATSPESSELGLPGLQSSTTDTLWNRWGQSTAR